MEMERERERERGFYLKGWRAIALQSVFLLGAWAGRAENFDAIGITPERNSNGYVESQLQSLLPILKAEARDSNIWAMVLADPSLMRFRERNSSLEVTSRVSFQGEGLHSYPDYNNDLFYMMGNQNRRKILLPETARRLTTYLDFFGGESKSISLRKVVLPLGSVEWVVRNQFKEFYLYCAHQPARCYLLNAFVCEEFLDALESGLDFRISEVLNLSKADFEDFAQSYMQIQTRFSKLNSLLWEYRTNYQDLEAKIRYEDLKNSFKYPVSLPTGRRLVLACLRLNAELDL